MLPPLILHLAFYTIQPTPDNPATQGYRMSGCQVSEYLTGLEQPASYQPDRARPKMQPPYRPQTDRPQLDRPQPDRPQPDRPQPDKPQPDRPQ